MRVLVTGGSGFIGTNLIPELLSRGDEVLNFDLKAPRNASQASFWACGDVRHLDALEAAVSEFKPDLVFHLAARTDLDGRTIGDYDSNTLGVSNAITALSRCGSVQRVVFASSRLVCEIGYQPTSDIDFRPSTVYGQSKAEGERIVRGARHGSYEWTIVRPTSIWGPWFGAPYNTFFEAIRHGRYLHPGNARILKSFGYVGNTVHELVALATAANSDVSEKVFYLADYKPIDVREMAAQISLAFGGKPIRSVPISFLRAAAFVGDLAKTGFGFEPPLTSFRLSNLLTNMVHDLHPLKSVVGPLPYSMDEGIKRTVEWLRRANG